MCPKERGHFIFEAECISIAQPEKFIHICLSSFAVMQHAFKANDNFVRCRSFQKLHLELTEGRGLTVDSDKVERVHRKWSIGTI